MKPPHHGMGGMHHHMHMHYPKPPHHGMGGMHHHMHMHYPKPSVTAATATPIAAVTAITAVTGAKATATTSLTPSLRRWRADCDWLWHWRSQWSDDWFCRFKR